MPTKSLPRGFQLIALDSVVSTNDEAKKLAERDVEDVTIVQAKVQTGGKGRRGRVWESGEGNLFFSFVLRPQCAPMAAPQLGFAASLAVAEAIEEVLPDNAEVTCKWPNDVRINGGKVAGILLEAGPVTEDLMDWLVIGMGINVASRPEDMPYPVTSVSAEGGKSVTPDKLLAAICHRFAYWRVLRRGEGFAPVRKAWMARAAGLGGPIRVELPNQTLTGTFEDLDGQGALLLLQENGKHTKITAGDVFLPGAGL